MKWFLSTIMAIVCLISMSNAFAGDRSKCELDVEVSGWVEYRACVCKNGLKSPRFSVMKDARLHCNLAQRAIQSAIEEVVLDTALSGEKASERISTLRTFSDELEVVKKALKDRAERRIRHVDNPVPKTQQSARQNERQDGDETPSDAGQPIAAEQMQKLHKRVDTIDQETGTLERKVAILRRRLRDAVSRKDVDTIEHRLQTLEEEAQASGTNVSPSTLRQEIGEVRQMIEQAPSDERLADIEQTLSDLETRVQAFEQKLNHELEVLAGINKGLAKGVPARNFERYKRLKKRLEALERTQQNTQQRSGGQQNDNKK